MAKLDIKVVTFECKHFDDEVPKWYDGKTATDFIAWLQSKVDEVPEEYRAKAHIEFSEDSFYDSRYGTLEVFYYRKETDAEERVRENQEIYKKHQRREALLAELEKIDLAWVAFFRSRASNQTATEQK